MKTCSPQENNPQNIQFIGYYLQLFMLKYRTTNINILFLILLAITTVSCTIEQKMARHYVRNVEKPSLMYISPDFIFKTNTRPGIIQDDASLDQFEKDSILFFKSEYLQFLEDSILLNRFNRAYISELKAYGIEVFKEDQMDAFLALEDTSYIVNIAQLELEEYIIPIRDEEYFDGVVYYREIDLDAVGLNSWFEISTMNDDEDPVVLFASHYVVDDYDGTFRYYPFTGEISHSYAIDSISIDDVYELVSFLGRKYAGYTFDFIMNVYIYSNVPDDVNLKLYYHYDRRKGSFIPVDDDRFIPLE